MMAKEKIVPDAGLKNLDHYKSKLPQWRYLPRQRLLPLGRWETPYLAWLQAKVRSPALDHYFAISANLGTHTFFMIVLPILFWCGYTSLGRGMVHILASGVFFSGFIKDLLCLPRPLSPPLKRITMSGSAALEYGFPSTHSTNAVSVAVYALFIFQVEGSSISPVQNASLQVFAYLYATSIVFGRLYCGMHGFLDVICGSLLGAILALIQCWYGEAFDNYIHSGSFKEIFVVVMIVLTLVRIHPEPADDCPCFDDSVAFAGVVIGTEFGNWHYGRSGRGWSSPTPATVPFDLEIMGWSLTLIRIFVGVLTIFAWRGVMKPSLLRCLPPVFRVVEKLGLSLPRKFFIQASEYTKIPKHLKYDDVMPSISDIPTFLSSIRQRRRSVSVGPQSEADAHEALAYRERRRRASLSSAPIIGPGSSPVATDSKTGHFGGDSLANGSNVQRPDPKQSTLRAYESMMGTGFEENPPENNATHKASSAPPEGSGSGTTFSRVEVPRVRYDVEVVTKLIIYSGIGWIAVEGNPILFDVLGLGI